MAPPGTAARPRRVLITNDDGPTSELFVAWMKHLTEDMRWDCLAIVPAQQESFSCKALSKDPFQVKPSSSYEGVWEANAPPATCVNVGLHHLARDADLVIAGPNIGHNVGRSALMSCGTTGAAMEGALVGRRAIALSFAFYRGFGNWTPAELDQAIKIAGIVVERLWVEWPTCNAQEGQVDVLNVNVPLGYRDAAGQPGTPGISWTGVDPSSLYQSLYAPHPEDNTRFVWAPDANFQPQPEPGTDFHAIMQGNVSITALQASYVQVRQLSGPWAGAPR